MKLTNSALEIVRLTDRFQGGIRRIVAHAKPCKVVRQLPVYLVIPLLRLAWDVENGIEPIRLLDFNRYWRRMTLVMDVENADEFFGDLSDGQIRTSKADPESDES